MCIDVTLKRLEAILEVIAKARKTYRARPTIVDPRERKKRQGLSYSVKQRASHGYQHQHDCSCWFFTYRREGDYNISGLLQEKIGEGKKA